ncbi:MAG: recombinase family protein [Alphaproteobacteria bacterium]
MSQQAVIYCRVSSQKQVREGHGLGSQETRCREYAKHKGYDVVAAFHEEGITGKLMDRPQMQEMLSYLRKHKKENPIVIIDDISRLARDIETHIHLRTAIDSAGGKLESPSIEFGDDSDSRLVEHLLASVAAHQREKNAEQVKNRMRAKVMNGYWVFSPVPGYRYALVGGHKMLVPDEPVASIIREALEGFASGRFETQTEVQRFLENQAEFPKNKKGGIHLQKIKDILERVLYAGYIDVPKWGISLHPGKHEALISFTTYQTIQKRLQGTANAPVRKDIHEDFPLRGFVTCGCCGNPMTAAWSKGRNGKYPYYFCHTKGCDDYRKSIRKEQMEEEFESLLMDMQSSRELFFVAAETFSDLWNMRKNRMQAEAVSIKREIGTIEKKTQQFLNRIVETDSSPLITAYENQVRTLEEQRIGLQEKIANCGRPLASFDDTFRTAMEFLGNPYKLWTSDRIEDKKIVTRLVFAEKLLYRKNDGFRTAQTTLPITVLRQLDRGDYEMVGPAGLEPATNPL